MTRNGRDTSPYLIYMGTILTDSDHAATAMNYFAIYIDFFVKS
jgi:hypothetical protein